MLKVTHGCHDGHKAPMGRPLFSMAGLSHTTYTGVPVPRKFHAPLLLLRVPLKCDPTTAKGAIIQWYCYAIFKEQVYLVLGIIHPCKVYAFQPTKYRHRQCFSACPLYAVVLWKQGAVTWYGYMVT